MEEIEFISRLGFDFAELHISNLIRNKEGEILDETRNLGLGLTGHLPDIDLCDPNLRRNRELLQRFCEGIDIFDELEIQKVVVHAFVGREVDVSKHPDYEIRDLKLQRLKDLTDTCKNSNIKLCVENTNENPEDFVIYFEELPSLFLCLDVGHANLFTKKNKSLDFLEKFGHRLGHIHMCDNFGGYSEKCDLHLPLGTGKIDFKPIVEYLKQIGYDDTITLEIVSRDREEDMKTSKRILKRLLDEVFGDSVGT